MNSQKKLISIIIPAFNEEALLSSTVSKHIKYLDTTGHSFEIIIVNDGSSDKTEKIANDLKKKRAEIQLINHKKNQGKARAVKNGMLTARGQVCLFIDADNATSIDHLDLAWEKLENGAQIVIGSRNPLDSQGAKQTKKQALHKRLLGKSGNFVIRKFTGQKIHDTQCGFKVFTSQAVQSLFPRQQSIGWLFDVELLLLARQFGFSVETVPVKWQCGPKSRVKISDYAKSLLELMRIRRLIKNSKFPKSTRQGS